MIEWTSEKKVLLFLLDIFKGAYILTLSPLFVERGFSAAEHNSWPSSSTHRGHPRVCFCHSGSFRIPSYIKHERSPNFTLKGFAEDLCFKYRPCSTVASFKGRKFTWKQYRNKIIPPLPSPPPLSPTPILLSSWCTIILAMLHGSQRNLEV